jgi:uncharacterized protein (DUF433 family)
MTIQFEFEASAPPFRWDEAQGIRIGKSRVTLDSLLASYNDGSTPEEIAVQYSVLHLCEIYSAIAYYLNHRREIDSYSAQRRQSAQQQHSEFVQYYSLADLRQRLSDRYRIQGELIGDASIS